MKIKGIRIPADPAEQMHEVELDRGDIKAIQALVNGMFDVIDLEAPAASFWLNDEGKIIGLPVNSRATTILWAFSLPWVGHDYLCGDVLVLGHPDGEGDTQSVPEELLKLLFEDKLFRIEVQAGGSTSWSTNNMLFTDWFSAAAFVIDLGKRWKAVTATRIVSAR